MTIAVTCPTCFEEYQVKDSLAGKKVRCKKCEGVIRVEQETEPELERYDHDEDDEAPCERTPRSTARKSTKSGKVTGRKSASTSGGIFADVPWKSAFIPLGIALLIFLLSRILPHPAVLLFKILSMLTTLGCALAGFYMLARVTSRAHGDVSMEHLHGVKRVGRVTGFGGGNAIIALLTLGFIFVAVKGMIRTPRQTLPWFAMGLLGVGGLIWIAKYDRDAFKPEAQRSQYQGPSSDDWDKWHQEMQHNMQQGPPIQQ